MLGEECRIRRKLKTLLRHLGQGRTAPVLDACGRGDLPDARGTQTGLFTAAGFSKDLKREGKEGLT